jgi:hypothetical protein
VTAQWRAVLEFRRRQKSKNSRSPERLIMQQDSATATAANNDGRFNAASLRWKLIVPIPAALLVAIAAAMLFVPRIIASNTVDAAVRASEQTAHQFKTIRGYYTDNVVSKAV